MFYYELLRSIINGKNNVEKAKNKINSFFRIS